LNSCRPRRSKTPHKKRRDFQRERILNCVVKSQNSASFARIKFAAPRKSPYRIANRGAKWKGFDRKKWDPSQCVQNAKPFEQSTTINARNVSKRRVPSF
jgi:hypothetical protein